MILLQCLLAKSNNITLDQFEYDVIFFVVVCLLLFDFVHSHAWCGFCSIVCLRFQVMQTKRVDCKMSTKKTFFKKTFCDIFG